MGPTMKIIGCSKTMMKAKTEKNTDIEHSLEGHTVSDQWFIQFNIFWQWHQGEFCGKACHSRSLILPSKG